MILNVELQIIAEGTETANPINYIISTMYQSRIICDNSDIRSY